MRVTADDTLVGCILGAIGEGAALSANAGGNVIGVGGSVFGYGSDADAMQALAIGLG